MADTNTYTSLTPVRKYLTQADFDAMDKTGIPVGTEYDLVGPVEKTDLSADLQSEIDGKIDKPATDGTAGQVLTLGTDGKAKWADSVGSTKASGEFYAELLGGDTPSEAAIKFIGGSGSYQSYLKPMKTGAHGKVIYYLPDTEYVGDDEEEQTLLSKTSMKTIFGNMTLYGKGNIDLYEHDIIITGTNINIVVSNIVSSKNTPVDSLNDMKLVCGDTFVKACSGLVNDKIAYKITETHIYCTDGSTQILSGVTFTDDVHTV